jgi:hypothetical protein
MDSLLCWRSFELFDKIDAPTTVTLLQVGLLMRRLALLDGSK